MENNFLPPEIKIFNFFQIEIFEILVLKIEIFSNIRNLRKYWNSFLKQINDAMTLETSSTSNSRWKLKFYLLFFENTNFCDFFYFSNFDFFWKSAIFLQKCRKIDPVRWKSFVAQNNWYTTIKTWWTPRTSCKLKICLLFFLKNNFFDFFKILSFHFFQNFRKSGGKSSILECLICWITKKNLRINYFKFNFS